MLLLNKFTFFCLFVFVSLSINSQNLKPLIYTNISLEEIPVYTLMPEKLKTDISLTEEKGKTLQIGIPTTVEIDLSHEGKWVQRDNQYACLLRIKSAGASHLNLLFSGMQKTPDSNLFAYAPDGNYLHRIEVLAQGLGASIPVEGDEMILEYNCQNNPVSNLQINQIVHGIKSLRKTLLDFKESGFCNVNINCPQGSGWTDQASGVVMILTNMNSRFCTGTLINNTSWDGTPYLLTAAHCEPAPTDLFMFNYQSPNCSNIDGQTNQIIQGCTVRASNAGSDFSLVELNMPPIQYNSFLCGWDREDISPGATTIIHHPEGDIKKIARDQDAPGINSFFGAICWQIFQYEFGTTEAGSSGAPMFNENKQIVGQLFGGESDCQYPENDYYGKFSISWDGNSTTERLKDWLDPKNKQVKKISGTPYQFQREKYDARLVQINSLTDVICGSPTAPPSIEIKNMGTDTLSQVLISYKYDADSVYSVSVNEPLAPLESTNVIIALPSGQDKHTLQCSISDTKPGADTRTTNDTLIRSFTITEGLPFTFSVNTDERPLETSFRLYDSNNELIFEQAASTLGDNSRFYFNFCLPAGCYSLEMNDNGGDGICCAHGAGSYTMYDPLNRVVFSGGRFGHTKKEDFCIEADLYTSTFINNSVVQVYPNPASGYLNINYSSIQGKKDFSIYNITGHIVYTDYCDGSQKTVDLNFLSPGIYYIKSSTINGSYTNRIIVTN